MRWKAELPKMPRLPRVPPDATQSFALPPAPSAYREKNPCELPPTDYQAPSMLAEHRGLALLFLAAVIAFALYCWEAPHRSMALDTPAQAGGGAVRTRGPETSQSPIYIETLPDKAR